MLYQVLSGIFLFFCAVGATTHHAELIATPYGMFPADCVHVAEEDNPLLVSVGNGVWANYPSGRRVFHPELPHCVENWKKIKQSRKADVKLLKEWEDYASATMPDIMGVFTAHYTLPTTSPDPTGGELLYYFIGMQDDGQADLTIIQPVVSFCAESTKCNAGQEHELPLGWSMMATNCCPSGQTWYGPVKALSDGAELDGTCQSNGTLVYITMTDSSGDTSSLSQPDTERKFNWAAVTLEQYYATKCSDYNTDPFMFTKMQLTSLNGNAVTPDWKTTTGGTCSPKVDVIDAFDVSIYGSGKR